MMNDKDLRKEVRNRGYRLRVTHVTDPEKLKAFVYRRRGEPARYVTVAQLLRDDEQVEIAIAACSPVDHPNRKLGRRIALRRLFHRFGWRDLEAAT